MTTFQIHETKTDQKREREIGKSTVLEMSTTSNHQSIEQLNKISVSKYTSHVKITDIYDQYAQQNSFHYRENVQQDRPHTRVQTSLNKLERMKIIHSTFSNHNRIKFKIQNNKISFQIPKYLEIEQYISA